MLSFDIYPPYNKRENLKEKYNKKCVKKRGRVSPQLMKDIRIEPKIEVSMWKILMDVYRSALEASFVSKILELFAIK